MLCIMININLTIIYIYIYVYLTDLMLPGITVNGQITPQTFSHITASLPVGVNAVGNRYVYIILTCVKKLLPYRIKMAAMERTGPEKWN